MHCFVDLSTSFCVSGIILKIEIQHKLFQFCHQFFYTSGSILKKEIQHKLFQRRGAAGGGGGLPSYAGLSQGAIAMQQAYYVALISQFPTNLGSGGGGGNGGLCSLCSFVVVMQQAYYVAGLQCSIDSLISALASISDESVKGCEKKTLLVAKKTERKQKSEIWLFIQHRRSIDKTSVCRFKSQSYLSPSSGISIVWRADSWRRRHATPQLSALPNDGDATRWR